LNQVASVAEAVDDIAFGTANGPTRFGPLVRAVSAAARSHDDAGALVRNVLVLEPGVADRLVHRDVIPARADRVEAHRAAIDDRGRIERRRAMHLAAEAELGVLVGARNAGLRLA
jgi:hypothetical protein